APGTVVEPVVVGWENPLERAGVRLAGERLTARDVTRMDLTETRAVVLPAVQTPAGLPNGWSKVSGLVNAFVYAGARNVVFSLWRAPEAARQEMVTAFYEQLGRGRGVAEALREARQQ